MSRNDLQQRWSALVTGDLQPSEQAGLIQQIESDPARLSEARQDLEIDGLLRALGREPQDTERFVASVLQRLESPPAPLHPSRFPVVPPPRVLPSVDRWRGQPAEASIESDSIFQPPQLLLDSASASRSHQDKSPDSSSRVWRTLVAPLAAVTLFAITLAIFVETDRFAKGPDLPEAIAPSAPADQVAEDSSSDDAASASENRTLADLQRRGAGHSEPRSDQREREVVAAGDSAAGDRPNSSTDRSSTDRQNPIRNGASRGFAVLTEGTSDVRWYHRPRSMQQGESLSLLSGEVEFRFASGATVTIEGPAEFEIDSANSLLLARGRVAADVPAQAVGFMIDTPTVRIVDLGTRFDTRVSSTGSVGLRVLEGSVMVKSTARPDQAIQGSVVRKGGQKFVEADGSMLDWMVEVAANVFGDVEVSINGQAALIEDADDIDALASTLDLIGSEQDSQGVVGRYVFNGQVQEFDSAARPQAATVIADELAALATIVRRASDQQGAYRLKTKQYPYSGLKDQLEARRKIARIYGPRALGGEFWPREPIQTLAANLDSLDTLQRDLIARLDFVDLRPSAQRRSTERQDAEKDLSDLDAASIDTGDDADDDAGDAAGKVGASEPGPQQDMLQRLDEIRRRKAASDAELPRPFDHLP